ncbi:MAG: head GIN domain-containing protein [Chitinophagales bacterium]
MNHILKSTSIIALMLTFNVCLQAQAEKVLSFDAVHVSGNVEVLLQQGSTESIDIEAQGVEDDKVVAEVQGGILKIHIKNIIYNKNKSARVVVNYRDLREIKGQAGARIYSRTAISGDNLEIKAGSGANIALEIWVDVVEGRAAEGGEIELTGEAHTLTAIASTGGLFYGYGLKAENVYAKTNTGGQVEVTANKRIEAKAGTGGNISFKGDPVQKETSTNFGGTIDGH